MPPGEVTKVRPTRPFVGDAGAGGKPGSVPAPAVGDGVRPKFLSAKGTWEEINRDNQGINFSVSLENLDVGAEVIVVDSIIGFSFADSGAAKRALSQVHTTSPLNLQVNPQLHFDLYTAFSGGNPGAGNAEIELAIKYIASGEAASKAVDETLTQTVAMSGGAKFTKSSVIFELNKALIADNDTISIVISRLSNNANDTYGGDILIGKFATLQFG